MTFRAHLLRGAASVALVAALSLHAGGALAQSTATQAQEIVITGLKSASALNGLATQVQDSKDVSIVNQDYFKTQIGSSNVAQLINLLPGVTYSTEDPTGLLSSDFRMHGFDGAHVSFQLDGSPINDTGNYASYPGEYEVSELTDHVVVNLGATDVDSPTASAVGGTINIVTKKPSDTFLAIGKGTGGSDAYGRSYFELDPGSFGGWSSFVSGNFVHAQKYKGDGTLTRQGYDFRVMKQFSGGHDFISLTGTWVYNTPYFYYDASRAQLASIGGRTDFDYNTVWVAPTAINGHADTTPSGPAPTPTNVTGFAGSDTNFWKLHDNPVKFGVLRGSSLFTLFDGVSLTFDPSFFYTLANGGGSTATSECDNRLKGNTVTATGTGGTCVDLNHDGDTLDTVPLYTPSNTNTRRITVNSSLLWDISEHHHIQIAYTLDYGMHRQTGEAAAIDLATGTPASLFGGKDGYAPTITSADGTFLRARDRHSIAELNQFAVNYIGKFFDDKLHIDIGFRDPFFTRKLDQLCYTYNGTSAYCTTANQANILAAYNAGVAAHNATALAVFIPGVTYNTAAGTPNFRFPFSRPTTSTSSCRMPARASTSTTPTRSTSATRAASPHRRPMTSIRARRKR